MMERLAGESGDARELKDRRGDEMYASERGDRDVCSRRYDPRAQNACIENMIEIGRGCDGENYVYS